MPVDLSKLNKLAILTNIPFQEAGPLPASSIFIYLKANLNTLSKTRIAIAEFDTQTHWRRRNPEDNSTLYNIELPRFSLTPDLSHRLLGSRTHIDASLAWLQPWQFGLYKTTRTESGMIWHYRSDYRGALITLPYIYWIDSISSPDERFYQLFW